MLVSIETGLSEIADALIESPLDDGFRAKVVGVCGGESQAEGVVLQVIPNSLRHLNGMDVSIRHYQDDCCMGRENLRHRKCFSCSRSTRIRDLFP